MKTNVLHFICIWSVLCFHIIILPPVNRQSFVCICICECISTRHKIKNRRKFLILWYPYGRRAHNSNENNKIEWMKTTFVTFSCILRLRSASHQTKNGQIKTFGTSSFECRSRIFITVAARASSTPFTCQLYLWLFIYFGLLSL